ncbi:MAG: hypothetical protein K6T63_11440, partial [Alicyclobacillus herbarius]|uniref:hypothetical protein n=1 Tax=Alicyclobacillus herbarius TaxID=122960 RepID=UPI00235622FD
LRHSFDEETELSVTHGNITFDTWLTKPFINQDLRERLKSANVLILPREGFGDYCGPLFPEGTEELFEYLRANSPEELIVDACIADDDFKTLSLHSDLIRLGAFLVSSVVLPVFLNLISSYVFEKVYSRKDDALVEFEMTVVRAGEVSTSVKFKGPVDTFKSTLCDKIDDLLGRRGRANAPDEPQ